MRTYLGHPSTTMRFRTSTATAIATRSLAVRRFASAAHCRFPVSSSQYRASTKACQLYTTLSADPCGHIGQSRADASHAIWAKSRAVGLGAALERGGTMTAASGWRGSDFAAEAVPVVCAIASERSDGTINLSSKGPTCTPSSVSLVVSAAGTTWINGLGGSELLRSRL